MDYKIPTVTNYAFNYLKEVQFVTMCGIKARFTLNRRLIQNKRPSLPLRYYRVDLIVNVYCVDCSPPELAIAEMWISTCVSFTTVILAI